MLKGSRKNNLFFHSDEFLVERLRFRNSLKSNSLFICETTSMPVWYLILHFIRAFLGIFCNPLDWLSLSLDQHIHTEEAVIFRGFYQVLRPERDPVSAGNSVVFLDKVYSSTCIMLGFSKLENDHQKGRKKITENLSPLSCQTFSLMLQHWLLCPLGKERGVLFCFVFSSLQ